MKSGRFSIVLLAILPIMAVILFVCDVYRLYTVGRTIVPQFGMLIGFFNPPNDYFLPRGKVKMHRNKNEYTIEYTHKYYGGYFVEVRFPLDTEVTEKIKTEMSFGCSYFDNENRLVRSVIVSDLIFHSDGRGSVFGIIDKYEVPRDLSIQGTWKIVISCYGVSESMFDKFEGAIVSVKKSSDE